MMADTASKCLSSGHSESSNHDCGNCAHSEEILQKHDSTHPESKLPSLKTTTKLSTPPQTPTTVNTPPSATSVATPKGGTPLDKIKVVDRKKITAVYSLEEVSKHNTKDDCWMIFKGHVYDVTPYFEFHPGGQRALLNFAGKDGTENVKFHSAQMMELLNKYFYIGRLEGTSNGEGSCNIM